MPDDDLPAPSPVRQGPEFTSLTGPCTAKSAALAEGQSELAALEAISQRALECERRLAQALAYALDPMTERAIIGAMRCHAQLRATIRNAGKFTVSWLMVLDADELRAPREPE